MLQFECPKLTPIQSIVQERFSLDDEGFLRNVFQSISEGHVRDAATGMCRGMLADQRTDVRDLVKDLAGLGNDVLPAIGTALAGLKEALSRNDYQAYLCDSLGPRCGTDHGLRHALRVYKYAHTILSVLKPQRLESGSAVDRLAWMAVFHDVAYVIRGSRSHQIYSAGYADAVLRTSILRGCLPSQCRLTTKDVGTVADGIWGHDKVLKRDDPLFDENAEALALRDADLLGSTMHFDGIVRIAKMNLFYWPGWRFYNPGIDVPRRLATLNAGKGAHLIDAVCDFVKNMLWKADKFFTEEANRIALNCPRGPEQLLKEVTAFIHWAANVGIGAQRLEETGTTGARLDAIRQCVGSLWSQRPGQGARS